MPRSSPTANLKPQKANGPKFSLFLARLNPSLRQSVKPGFNHSPAKNWVPKKTDRDSDTCSPAAWVPSLKTAKAPHFSNSATANWVPKKTSSLAVPNVKRTSPYSGEITASYSSFPPRYPPNVAASYPSKAENKERSIWTRILCSYA